MQRTMMVTLCSCLFYHAMIETAQAENENVERPNVLWITLEDMSPDLACYGDPIAVTPQIDALAKRGVRYARVWSNAGMCAPARATLITGMYPPSTGAQNMRSDVKLPDFVRAFPEYLRHQGYYCSNHVKTDYNWQAPASTWDRQHQDWVDQGWRQRKADQPFFTVINITDTHSSQLYYRGERNWKRRVAQLPLNQVHDPRKIIVPPYYPDTPEVRGDLARYYDNISYADGVVGKILRQLEEDDLADDTIVFFFSDHGRGMPRSKSWCFESSLRVPLIVHFPEKYQHLAPAADGEIIERLVSFVDLAPTVLSLCGIDLPDHFQGTAFLGSQAGTAEKYAFAFRDRMDERYELIRAVTDGRFKYIRNYLPHLPWFHEQTRNYPRSQPTYLKWHELSGKGELSGPTAIYMAHSKPREQLFDLSSDPHELENLANSPRHQETLQRLRGALQNWMVGIDDLGFMPEPQWFTRFEEVGDNRPRHTIVRESPEHYPLRKIMAVADLVGAEGPDVLRQQRESLVSTDPAIRYWAATGLVAQPSVGRAELEVLEATLDDPIPSCQIAAAQALLTHTSKPHALDVIVNLLTHEQLYVDLLAANALEHVGEAANPASRKLQQLGQTSQSRSDQAGGWVVSARDAIIARVMERASRKRSPWVNLLDEGLAKWRGYQMSDPPVGWMVEDGAVIRQFAPGQEPTEFAEGGVI